MFFAFKVTRLPASSPGYEFTKVDMPLFLSKLKKQLVNVPLTKNTSNNRGIAYGYFRPIWILEKRTNLATYTTIQT